MSDNKNRNYVIYSLVVPIIFALMSYINLHFGSTEGETVMRPYGVASDIISFILFVVYIFLCVKHFILFRQNSENKNLINRLMLIFNTVYAFICFVSLGSVLLGGILIVLTLLSGLIILYIIIYCIQIWNLVKILTDK